MQKLAVILADGMEEIEALTPVDVLRRCGAICDTVAIFDKVVTGSHAIPVVADKTIDQVDFNDYDGLIIPGGMPGAKNISECKKVIDAIKNFLSQGKLVSAICASPAVVLASHKLVDGVKMTCYPAKIFVDLILPEFYTGEDVEIDKNVITANGPKSALKFSLAICQYLGLTPKF